MTAKRTKILSGKLIPAVMAILFLLVYSAEAAYASEDILKLKVSENVEYEVLEAAKYNGFFDDDETTVLAFTAKSGSRFPETGYIYLSGVVEDSSKFHVYYQEDDGFTFVEDDDYDENGIKIYAQSEKIIIITANSNAETTATGTVTVTEETDFWKMLSKFVISAMFILMFVLIMALFILGVI